MSEHIETKIQSLQKDNEKLRKEIEFLKQNQTNSLSKSLLENAISVGNDFSLPAEYVSLLNSMPVGILVFDVNKHILSANVKLGEMFSVSTAQLIGFNLLNLKDKNILPAIERSLAGKAGFYEGQYTPTFGDSVKHIIVQTAPINFVRNQEILTGGVAIFEDISDKHVAEVAQNKVFDVLQTVTDNINAIIYAVDTKTHQLLFVNKRAQSIFGTKNRVVCLDDLSYDRLSETCMPCILTSEEFKTLKFGETYYKEAFNTIVNRWFQYSYSLTEWINGETALLVTSIDIQTLKNALSQVHEQNEHINKQAEALKEEARTKDAMFSIIGHDLRGPIGNIKSALDLLVEEFDIFGKEAILEIVNPVRDSAGSAYTLLSNLLNWAKNQSGQIGFRPEELDIEDIVSENLMLFKTQSENKKIEISYQSSFDGSICADDNMVNTILRNLISNAIKFTSSGGFVVINVESELRNLEEFVKIEVCDTGIGMSNQRLEEIFSNQKPGSSYGTNNEKGSGLGIMLCKAFVAWHNGFFEADSQLGSGTCFRVVIPVRQHSQAE